MWDEIYSQRNDQLARFSNLKRDKWMNGIQQISGLPSQWIRCNKSHILTAHAGLYGNPKSDVSLGSTTLSSPILLACLLIFPRRFFLQNKLDNFGRC